MFIGDLIKLKSDVTRNDIEKQQFIKDGIKENWIWLITSIDDEGVDYMIQPLYLNPDYVNTTQLGKELFVLHNSLPR